MPLNPPLHDWPGRWVWVIGASSGIGRATAAALHAQGARVVVSARQADALQVGQALAAADLDVRLDAGGVDR